MTTDDNRPPTGGQEMMYEAYDAALDALEQASEALARAQGVYDAAVFAYEGVKAVYDATPIVETP